MKLSTRTRYGVRMMLALAREYGNGTVYLKDVARAEEISEKYLSQIIIPLKGIGLVRSTRGAHGGYALAKPPAEITLREIVDILEGDCLIDCLKNSSCLRMASCASRDVWAMLGLKIAAVLESVTLEELLRREREKTGRFAGGNI